MAVKTVNLPDELWERLDSQASLEGRSRSNVMVVLLEDGLLVRREVERRALDGAGPKADREGPRNRDLGDASRAVTTEPASAPSSVGRDLPTSKQGSSFDMDLLERKAGKKR